MRFYRIGLLLIALAAFALLASLRAWNEPSRPEIRFYGKVVDEAGAPVPDAEVAISVWTVPPGWSSRKGPPLSEVTKRVSLRTGIDGKFTVIGERGYMLQVLDVRKSGHVWLVDWGWGPPNNTQPDNRFFIFGGGFPVYVPDEAKPATFPLLRENSTIASLPSRGGADQSASGQVTPNEPTEPIIPSTGPGTPKSVPEKDKRLRDLVLSGNATRPAENETSVGAKKDSGAGS